MEASNKSNRIHPLVATAAVSVTLVSLTGIAAMTGLLPTSHSTTSPQQPEKMPLQLELAEDKAQEATDRSKLLAVKPEAEPEPAKTPKTAAPAKEEKAARTVQRPAAPVASRESAIPETPDYSQRRMQAARASYCDHCGRIESVDAITQAAAPSGLGIAAGAVIGGLLGNQIGDGSGRKIATVAGAVGGGYAGNEVEKRTRASTTYEVRVRMEDGSIRTISQRSANGWQVGDRVRIVNGSLVSDS